MQPYRFGFLLILLSVPQLPEIKLLSKRLPDVDRRRRKPALPIVEKQHMGRLTRLPLILLNEQSKLN